MHKRDTRTGQIGTDRYKLVQTLIDAGKTTMEIANELNVNYETVRRHLKTRGLTPANGLKYGANHPGWGGGIIYDIQGYQLTRVPVDSEYGYLIRALTQYKRGPAKHGYAPVHRIVMHQKLGRQLAPGEVVHHIDDDKLNNAPDNLDIFASNGQHLAETLKGKTPNWSDEGRLRIFGRKPATPAP